jgi:hypothetical protein
MDEDNGAQAETQVFPRVQLPVVNKSPSEMDFFEALKQTIDGKKITRLAWESNATFGQMVKNELMIFIRGEYHSWTIVPGDITGTDWIVLPE